MARLLLEFSKAFQLELRYQLRSLIQIYAEDVWVLEEALVKILNKTR